MSLLLARGTKPKNLNLKTWPHDTAVFLGKYEISIEDFEEMVIYVMTNLDLHKNDVRLRLLRRLKKLKQDEGWNSKNKRLVEVDGTGRVTSDW